MSNRLILIAMALILGSSPAVTGGACQKFDESELPPRNEAVLSLLKEAAPAINRSRRSNHPACRQLILAFLDAGDYDSALQTLLNNQKKFTYPIQDTSYYIARTGRLRTAFRMIRDYYAAQGVDVWKSELSPAMKDRFHDALEQFTVSEILNLLRRFHLRSVRSELLKGGILRAARRKRIELAKNMARLPEADDSLPYWARALGAPLAESGDWKSAQILAMRLLNRSRSLDKTSQEFIWATGGASRTLTAIGVWLATTENDVGLAEKYFRIAHSIRSVPVEPLLAANREDLAIEFYRDYEKRLPASEEDARRIQVFEIRGPRILLTHPLATGAETTSDVQSRVRLLAAIQFPELQVPGIVDSLRWIQERLVDETDPGKIEELELARARLQAMAITSLEAMEYEWARHKTCRDFVEYLADVDECEKAMELFHRLGNTTKETEVSRVLMHCASRSVRFGRLENAQALIEQWDLQYPSETRELVQEMARARLIDDVAELLDKIPLRDYELNHAIDSLSEYYPWRTTWQFATTQFGDRIHPINFTRIFRGVASQEGKQEALKAYRWMREEGIDGFHSLVGGLVNNNDLDEACLIVADLLSDPPDKINHGFPDKDVIVGAFMDRDDPENAWRLAWYGEKEGHPDLLRPILVPLLRDNHRELLEQLIGRESQLDLRNYEAELRESVIQLALAQSMLEIGSEAAEQSGR